MSEQKRCNRCERGIDAWSKICPFCNWDQTSTQPPPPMVVPAAVAEYRPPDEFEWKKKLIFAGGGVLVLILAFLIGMVINQDGAPERAPETVEEQVAAEKKAGPVKQADTPLVPMNEPGGIEQPITSAPATAQPGTPATDYQRTDATAVSADDYAEMARRARAEKKKMTVLVDPRSLTGPAYAQAPQRTRSTPMQSAQAAPAIPGSIPGRAVAPGAPAPQRSRTYRTRPVPQYQPLPRMSAQGAARLSLLVGADGRVKEVDIERPLDRDTARLLHAVQSWRFKPATENGEPVASRYSVEISFKR
ncbi:MAG TPA: TonB family protein [Thermoanaerobaculia bacterium]|nr:TonB family protein [Thermoanaerobaculia bacterium]